MQNQKVVIPSLGEQALVLFLRLVMCAVLSIVSYSCSQAMGWKSYIVFIPIPAGHH